MTALGPRLVVAGTHSGVGKTTVATGLMAALRARGVKVASAKVGPDFVDPGYHALATGRAPRNLDAWICGEAAIGPLAGRAAADADVLVVEGVMGMFDGQGDTDTASTAHVARLLDAPVVLVVDASSMSRSVVALVHGYTTFDPRLRIGGVVLNRVGSDSHEALLRSALAATGLPVLGVLRRDDSITWRDRHLGLVPVVEQHAEIGRSLARLAATIERSVDLDAVMRLAASADPKAVAEPSLPTPLGRPVRIAVAAGPAFSFTYADNIEALEAAGAEVLPFDPCSDRTLPAAIAGLYAGGGFPEVFVAELAANTPLLADVRRRMADGLVVLAECGGLLWLARSLDGRRLAGVVEADGKMTTQLTLGYRRAVFTADTPIAAAGTELRGHEFHYSVLDPPGSALTLIGRTGPARGGFAGPRLLASYLHLHFGGNPLPATRFVATSAAGTTPAV